MIAFTDLFQKAAHAIQGGELTADSGKLIGMKRELTILPAGIIHVQYPLQITLPAAARETGDTRRVKSATLQQSARSRVVESRQLLQ